MVPQTRTRCKSARSSAPICSGPSSVVRLPFLFGAPTAYHWRCPALSLGASTAHRWRCTALPLSIYIDR